MSALAGARAAFVAQVAAALPDVQVTAAPPAEDQKIAESIYVTRASSRFDWRCIGPRRSNRSENVVLEVTVEVYRHAGRQQTAVNAALVRCDALLEAIEHVVADGLDLNGTVTHARVSEWSTDPQARESGWSVVGTLRVEADNFPTS